MIVDEFSQKVPGNLREMIDDHQIYQGLNDVSLQDVVGCTLAALIALISGLIGLAVMAKQRIDRLGQHIRLWKHKQRSSPARTQIVLSQHKTGAKKE